MTTKCQHQPNRNAEVPKADAKIIPPFGGAICRFGKNGNRHQSKVKSALAKPVTGNAVIWSESARSSPRMAQSKPVKTVFQHRPVNALT
jgi:hypothetical protein